MVHYAGYTPRFHPSDFHTFSLDGVGADWPIRYDDLRPYYQALEAGAPGVGPALAVGRPAHLPLSRPTGRRQRGDLPRGARRPPGSRPGSVPWRSPMAGSATGTTASTGGSACRAARSTPRPPRSSPTCPTPWPTAARSGPTAWSPRWSSTATGERAGWSTCAVGSSTSSGRKWWRWRATPSKPHACCCCPHVSASPTGCATTSGKSGATSWCRAPRKRPEGSNKRSACTRLLRPRCRPSSFMRPTRPRITAGVIPSRTSRRCPSPYAEHVTAQGHWGSVLREYVRDYVHWATLGALCEFLPRYDNHVGLAQRTDRHGLPVAQVFLQSVRQRPPAAAGAKAVIDSTLAGVVWGDDPMDVAALNEAMARACRNRAGPGWSPVRSRPWISRCGTSRPVCSTCRWPTCSGGPWCPYPSRRCHWSLGKQASSAATPATLASSRIVAPQVRSSATGGMA